MQQDLKTIKTTVVDLIMHASGDKPMQSISDLSDSMEYFPPTIDEQIVKWKLIELQKKSFTFLALVFFFEVFRKYGRQINAEQKNFKQKLDKLIS